MVDPVSLVEPGTNTAGAGPAVGGVPAVLTGVRVGYLRISSAGQGPCRGLKALTAAGCSPIFTERDPGKDSERPELAAALGFLRPGDVLVVPSLARLGRCLPDLIGLITDLHGRGVGFVSLREDLDTTTPEGAVVFGVFDALAEFIRELVITAAHQRWQNPTKAPGRPRGGPGVTTPEIIQVAREMLSDPTRSIDSIAELLGVSKGTLYNHIPDLAELRSRGTGKIPDPRPVHEVGDPTAVPPN
jgi:DNA invertase Pin-like site-specific DNA recombinase